MQKGPRTRWRCGRLLNINAVTRNADGPFATTADALSLSLKTGQMPALPAKSWVRGVGVSRLLIRLGGGVHQAVAVVLVSYVALAILSFIEKRFPCPEISIKPTVGIFGTDLPAFSVRRVAFALSAEKESFG